MWKKKIGDQRVRLLPWGVLLLLLATLSNASQAANGVNMVGMNVHIPSPQVVDLAADLGIQWLRVDNPWHAYANACSPDMQFPRALDLAVQHARQRGLQVYLGLGFTPPCASTGGDDVFGHNDVPAPAYFADFARRSVARYRRLGVRHFGMWNEPNLSFFFEGTVAQYVDHVVRPGFAAIAQGCAEAGYDDCLVLGPDLAHKGDYDDFLEAVLRRMQAVGLMFDIFTHHIYQPVATPIWERDSYVNALDDRRFATSRRSLIDVLEDVGLAPGRIPMFDVWITETGLRASPPTDPRGMAKQAASYMEVLNAQAARTWYTNTMFYEIVDAPLPNDAGYGILGVDEQGGFILKDAYVALQNRLASDPRFAPHGPPAGYRPNASTTCARLGKRGFFRLLDQDRFAFHGEEGELVTATLEKRIDGNHKGSRATLIFAGHDSYFFSRGQLPNDIIKTLPKTGRYRIYVVEQSELVDGAPFRGEYCLTLESSRNAHTTLAED